MSPEPHFDSVSCKIWKKIEKSIRNKGTSRPDPESQTSQQQQPPYEKRLCCKPYHRNKVQRELSWLSKILTVDGTTHDPHTHGFEDTPVSQGGKHHTKVAQNIKTWESKPEIAENMNKEPAGAFIRFTWKDGVLANGSGQLDRFLSTGSILHSRWHVAGFLRNESFADVYSLNKPPLTLLSGEIGASLEAHVFLDEYYGNCAAYASRLKNRMRQSGNCLDIFWHSGRHVFIMKLPNKPVLFKLRNTKEEFPALVDQDKCNERMALQRRRFRGRPSFAVTAGGEWPDASPEFRPVPVNEGKSALEKELERIEKARVKKAERQRVKRKLQREKKHVEKECRSVIPMALMGSS
ncbi:hypothetical protein COCMIDRAFT_102113 [Bipolaris oryzae ATCC 44560]|uniref:Uncharacterized protein n=1 Tax=Bipolaris oryzae ATCC 44560 TaxID=930090 RepID=W6Z5X5_COCMI|nr:uncharacterized protein COCMIDRAFT_102113 [Bipolaris oryzae ATCC 44560]EUC42959.1 hypothetical protein COCMIDRAFT_102113 [Bipolaris oryzae ATCC 44560]